MATINVPGYRPASLVDSMEEHEADFAKAIFDREERELMDIPERYYVGFFGGKVDSIWEQK